MNGSVLVALAAAVGNLLQGWDNATIAGAVLYIKREFKLESHPEMEGLIVASALIGATLITTFSGAVADWVGRRPMLILSSVLYFFSGLLMLWSPSVHTLLLARLIDGFAVGLAVTLVPVYISETAPPEIRGQLNTFPQFMGAGGMLFSYIMVFFMTLTAKPDWRLMLGVLSVPSLIYFLLTVMFLPESPRWLVSKGRMFDARIVLQRLRGREHVSGEMALLVEGLGTGGETTVEEYIITSPDDQDQQRTKDQIRLYGSEAGVSWLARPAPIRGQSTLGLAVSRSGSIVNAPLVDPVVTLFGSVHENMNPDQTTGSMLRSALFPNFGSMFNAGDQQHQPPKTDQWDEESVPPRDDGHEEEDYEPNEETGGDDSDTENSHIRSPLLSRQTTGGEGRRQGSMLQAGGDTAAGIGGGWQLAYKKVEKRGPDGKKESGFKRVYLHQEPGAGGTPGSMRGSLISLHGGGGESAIQASALVSQSALHFSKQLIENEDGHIATIHPSEEAVKERKWGELFEPGVKRALIVGVGLQILQQFAGINGVLFYTPQILDQAGVGLLLANLGLSSESASILISALTSLVMLPCIVVAMRLMDVSGRRSLLLSTIPILLLSLVTLVISNVLPMSNVIHAVLSTASVVAYFGFFVMGFGPVPNILCAEIFPTRVRGACIAICALTFWICDIIVTYSLPVMLKSIGLAGVFGFYAVVCCIAFVFVFLKVPETKGMPLEVITEFFSVGAKQGA